MKLVVLYRPKSEHSRRIEDFIRDYEASHEARSIEVIDIDSREGMATASLYDVVDYPAILALQSDGNPQKIWQGNELPLMDEVAAYVRA